MTPQQTDKLLRKVLIRLAQIDESLEAKDHVHRSIHLRCLQAWSGELLGMLADIIVKEEHEKISDLVRDIIDTVEHLGQDKVHCHTCGVEIQPICTDCYAKDPDPDDETAGEETGEDG